MSNSTKKNSKASIITRDIDKIASKTGNLYESLNVIATRARQLSLDQRDELKTKLDQFATNVDNLEEIFENREQIEISRYYERMPKATSVAIQEFMTDELMYGKKGQPLE